MKAYISPEMIIRVFEQRDSKFSAVQVFMALDEWNSALDAYIAAAEPLMKIEETVAAKYPGYGSVMSELYECRTNPAYAKMTAANLAIYEALNPRCPLVTKWTNRHEPFPVGTAMREATKYRRAAKLIAQNINTYLSETNA